MIMRKSLKLWGRMIGRGNPRKVSVEDVAPPPLKPGEAPVEESERPPEANGSASEPGEPPNRKSSGLNGPDAINPEVALLLEQRFGISAELWMKMRPTNVLPPARDETDT